MIFHELFLYIMWTAPDMLIFYVSQNTLILSYPDVCRYIPIYHIIMRYHVIKPARRAPARSLGF